MGYLASSPEFRAYEENVFVATGGEKILPFRPADGFILVKNRQIQYPTVDWFINTDGKAELKTAAAVGDTFLIINLASFLISGCATKDEIAESASKPKFPLFDLTWRPSRASILDGTVPADGDTYSRTTYPDAFAAIQAGLVPVCTDAEWLADPSKHGFYTLGDGSTTFRVPDYNGKKTDAIASVVLRGDGKNAGSFGQIQQDCIRNITGSFGFVTSNTGVFIQPIAGSSNLFLQGPTGPTAQFNTSGFSTGTSFPGTLIIDSSRVVPTGPENRMTNVAGVWCIRLFNGRVLDGNIDLAALQADIKKSNDLVPEYGGFSYRNKLINSDMSIWQRGTPSSSISSGNSKYAADRFLVHTEGSIVTPYREGAGSGVPFRTCMAIGGDSSNTKVTIGQRIESINCDFVVGEQVTFSAYIKSPSRREVTLKLHSPNSTDAWSSGYSTIVSEARTIPGGGWARVSITVPVTENMRDGVQAHVDFGAITSGVLYTSGWQLESGSRATQLERRPLTIELPLCQYYYLVQKFDFGISHVPVFGNSTWAAVNFSINVRSGAKISGSVSGQTNMNGTINPQLGANTNIVVGANPQWAYPGGALNMLKVSLGGGIAGVPTSGNYCYVYGVVVLDSEL